MTRIDNLIKELNNTRYSYLTQKELKAFYKALDKLNTLLTKHK